MAERAAEIANLLLREGVLQRADPVHQRAFEELMGDNELFRDVARRLESVGYTLEQRLGHLGVRLGPDALADERARNRQGLHAGHIRLLVYLWVQLVYREWNNLHRDAHTLPQGRAPDMFSGDEPIWMPLSQVRAEFGQIWSATYLKTLLARLRDGRFIQLDERRDRVTAEAALYILLDQHRMEEFVIDLARRLGETDPAEAIKKAATGSQTAATETE